MEATDERIVWTPTLKQSEFLSAGEFEVLYGGAVGGGKTDGILIDALGIQHGAIEKRSYQGIIFRRSYPDLKDVIDRSHEIYLDVAPSAKFDKQSHVWTFPSGARIEFGFIQRDSERFRYRGRAFQYVGWEELTLWPTDVPYRYLLSRVRSTDPEIPCFVRSTTNPDGPGFKWVKERWQIPMGGSATCFAVEMRDEETQRAYTRHRRFIPARVEDNPYLGDDYVATLLLLDADDRRRLRSGLWETPQLKGAYYTTEIDRARLEGRIGKVPFVQGVPVNTFWDIGANDTTAIWCHQEYARQHRFIKAYEASGEPFSHFSKWLTDQGYVYGVHHLPHDADQRKQGRDEVKTAREMLEDLMPSHTFVIVPRVQDVLIGIQMTRDVFGQCCFDASCCAEGLSAVENYQKLWDEQQQTWRAHPKHDWASNYADALRQFAQGYHGARPAARHSRRSPPSHRVL